MTKIHNFRKENNDTVTHIFIVRKRLGRQGRNKHITNSTGRPPRDYISCTEENQNGASPRLKIYCELL
jgi:hypothetical protein